MPKIDISKAVVRTVAAYPGGLHEGTEGRTKIMLGDVCGLTQFGVNLTRLKPGALSAHRHWHENEDEFVYIVEGEAVLIEDAGETVVRPGDVLAWKAGVPDGHRLHNRSSEDCVFIAISGGDKTKDSGEYPDIDLIFDAEGYARKDGTRYPARRTP